MAAPKIVLVVLSLIALGRAWPPAVTRAAETESGYFRFQRVAQKPLIPRTQGTFYSVFAANPDILPFGDRIFLYFRGQSDEHHDQVAVAAIAATRFDGVTWEWPTENPVIRVSPKAVDHDSDHILDPAAVLWQGKVYLYYTAHSRDRTRKSSTGLAVSDDGFHFSRHPSPVVADGIAPEVIEHQGRLHLFVQRQSPGKQHVEILKFTSDDGVNFPESTAVKVFGPSGVRDAFDGFSVVTCRIFRSGDWFWMTYGGCDRHHDYPVAIGLARSRDLVHWDRYPKNPVFQRGEPGTWDEGAVWFATVFEHRQTYYMFYEGAGTGLGLGTPEARAASQRAREQAYGGYGDGSNFSQVGVAVSKDPLPQW